MSENNTDFTHLIAFFEFKLNSLQEMADDCTRRINRIRERNNTDDEARASYMHLDRRLYGYESSIDTLKEIIDGMRRNFQPVDQRPVFNIPLPELEDPAEPKEKHHTSWLTDEEFACFEGLADGTKEPR